VPLLLSVPIVPAWMPMAVLPPPAINPLLLNVPIVPLLLIPELPPLIVPLLASVPNETAEPTEIPIAPPETDPEPEIVMSVLEVALTGPVCAELMVCAFAVNGVTAASDAATASESAFARGIR